jgi:N-acetylglucosaminyldiphosphoundecaprenol N-acetyl-beta-D-mannosaminyltransferase
MQKTSNIISAVRIRSEEVDQTDPQVFRVLGIGIHAVQIADVIRIIKAWIQERSGPHYVVVANVHVLVEGTKSLNFKDVLLKSDLCIPDGMPLVWLGRSQGHTLKRRCYGPDLMAEFCHETHMLGYKHFFYGAAPGVAEKLAVQLKKNYSALEVVGTYSPPFRPLTPVEDNEVVQRINAARPDILWVGLGCPKQERWMLEHRSHLNVPVMLGVGQAFDIYAGRVRQAPSWMREHGFEWLFRLVTNPRRLWRRYLVFNTRFLVLLLLQKVGLRDFD